MHVYLRRSGAIALLAAATAFLSASCAEDDSSIFIRGCMIVSRTDCSVQVTLTPNLQLEGTIDAAFAGEYVCTMLVENQLVARGDPTTLKTETSGVELYEAEVQVLSAAGAVLNEFSVPITGFLDPGMSGEDGAGASEVVMIDAATLQSQGAMVASTGIQQQVVSSVIAKGRTLGGLEVHTQKFLFPILISNGSSCATTPGMPCVGGTMTTSTADCRLGIDEPAGSNCSLIASTLGACNHLECSTKGDPTTAYCPVHSPPDNSCCP